MKNILIFTFLLCSHFLIAQTISGKVTDLSSSPIIGAFIYSSTSNQHSHTDYFGKFSLENSIVGDTLSITYLGYQTIEYILEEKDFKQEILFSMKEAFFNLEQVSISNSVKNVNSVSSIDLKITPVNSSQEILRKVPGLFIGQHAGGGKAEQIFLRGFDIDHGTDITISVDGMPVNMVSHAHGQGYADLHLLIPETIANIDFGKGPYYSDTGNFNTAGYVAFKTKDKIEENSIGLEYGQFNTFRFSGLMSLLDQEKHHAYIATEYLLSDGPVASPQNFNRINLMGKYSGELENKDRISIIASHFQSKWDASGQIPNRLVQEGIISRFGSVDDTEGGETSRTNFAINHTKVINENSFLKTNLFYSKYDFELYSNFTFFLNDPVNGDQIRQKENRNIYGFNSKLFQSYQLNNSALEMSYGLGLRYDDINNNELSRSKNRVTTLSNIALGEVDETNISGFVNASFDFGKWLINPGLRLDAFDYKYEDRLQTTFSRQSSAKAIVSPKLNFIYNPTSNLQLFFKSGIGFHSNDSRVVLNQNAEEVLPKAFGLDLGTTWKPAPRIWINSAIWYLFLEQEFVYVGDEGIVEPSGKTRRTGIDLSARLQLSNFLFLDTDFNYTIANSIDEPKNNNRIPLAPLMTSSGGLTYKHPNQFSADLRYRFIKDRPATEDNSIIAEGYFIVDFNTSYRFKNITLGLGIENLLNTEWNEAQFATESRLVEEPEGIEEIHFTPGTPFFIKGNLRFNF